MLNEEEVRNIILGLSARRDYLGNKILDYLRGDNTINVEYVREQYDIATRLQGRLFDVLDELRFD